MLIVQPRRHIGRFLNAVRRSKGISARMAERCNVSGTLPLDGPIRGRVLPVHGAIDLFKGRPSTSEVERSSRCHYWRRFSCRRCQPRGLLRSCRGSLPSRYRSIANQALGRRLWHARARVWCR
jgi:hypothetical protein